MTVEAVATDYIERGWRVVPLKGKVPWNIKENCALKGWTDPDQVVITTANLDQFFNGITTGVGVSCKEIADIDLDCAAARYLAPKIMTPTARFGRDGKTTHLVYDCDEEFSRDVQFPGEGDHMEVRATKGMQTMFPGSLHPNGEQVEWLNKTKPVKIDQAKLKREVDIVAIACIVAHFYEHGNRDNLITILAHLLWKYLELPESEVQHVCDAVMSFNGDADPARLHKPHKLIEALQKKPDAKKPGIPKLKEIIGDEWTDKVVELLEAEAIDWPEPLDVFGEIDTPTVPVDAVPEIALKWAADIAERANAPLECALFPLMVQMMDAAGATVRIQLRPEWTEPAIFFSYVAVKSGSGKSPAMKEAFRPLQKLNVEADNERRAMIQLRAQVKERNDALPPRSTDKEPLPTVPPITRHILRDVTIETVAERYQDNPRGLCNVHDELSMFANSGKRYGNAGKGSSIDEQIWCSMYDGDGIVKDRSTGKSIFTRRSCISIFGGIQPGRLSDLVHRDNEALGLVARFNLIALPKLPPVEIVRREADNEARTLFEDRLAWLRNNILYDDDETLLFDAQENVAFQTEDERLRNYARELGEPFCAHISKYFGLLARVSLCFHLMTFDTDDVVEIEEFSVMNFEGVRDVPEETVEMAIRFLDYLHAHAVAVYKLTGSTEAETTARDIAEVILKKGEAESITVRDLERTGRGKLKHKDAIIEGLEYLDRYDWGQWEPYATTSAGRRSPRFLINPNVFEVDWRDLSCQGNDLSCQYGTDRKEPNSDNDLHEESY